MEHTYPVDRDTQSTAPRHVASPASHWPASEDAHPDDASTFADQMAGILGTHVEPDPLFFIETWTSGLEAATLNFQARHPNARPHDAAGQAHTNATPSHLSFTFSVPLIFVQDTSSDRPDSSAPSSGFSAAWKDAYGTRSSSTTSHFGAAHRDTTSTTPAPSQPLTIDDACRLLGVPATSSRRQIKTAYRQLVWRYHPDRLIHSTDYDRRIATERMTSLNQAYHLLCDSAPHSI